MTREKLLKSKEYWLTQMQIRLYETVSDYVKGNNLLRYQLAVKVGVSEKYIKRILDGDFDDKISKYVEIFIACGKVPVINIQDLNE